jgi:hypothetical protein
MTRMATRVGPGNGAGQSRPSANAAYNGIGRYVCFETEFLAASEI